jgi:RNA polymerase sigma-70 factor (ECF subfamily)
MVRRWYDDAKQMRGGMMADPADAELVTLTRTGDAEAYGALVARYQGHVYGLAYSLVDNWADAQDVAQETFIRAYFNLDQLRDPARFPAWLRRVTFSVTMNWLKAHRPAFFQRLDGRVDLDSLEIPDFQPGPAEVVEKRELAEAVLRAVASLPPKYRVPLTMFHLDGLSYEKVADFLDIPLGTAKALIHRARAKLRAALPLHVTEGMIPTVQEVFNEHKLPPEFARRVLENVPRLGWRQGRDNTFIGALTAAANAMGDDVSYDYVMGVSGAAFKVHLCQPEWCPSAGDAGPGFDCAATATAAASVVREDPNELRFPLRQGYREQIGAAAVQGAGVTPPRRRCHTTVGRAGPCVLPRESLGAQASPLSRQTETIRPREGH